MYNQFYLYTGDSYMIVHGPSFFPQILQNIELVLSKKNFSYDTLYLLYVLIKNESNTYN